MVLHEIRKGGAGSVRRLLSERQIWDCFVEPGADRASADDGGGRLGVLWVPADRPIALQVEVNGVASSPIVLFDGGRVVRGLALAEGWNRLGWTIWHTIVPWRHSVYLRLGHRVEKLEERFGSLTHANVYAGVTGETRLMVESPPRGEGAELRLSGYSGVNTAT